MGIAEEQIIYGKKAAEHPVLKLAFTLPLNPSVWTLCLGDA